jgi:hypothetical protein
MSIEVADIFRKYGLKYRYMHKLSKVQLKAMKSIEVCRTAYLGGHIDKCDHCGEERISYNSCRNRHCPKCQHTTTAQWIEARKADILPVPYFHAVFTIPDALNHIALYNQKTVYDILFKSVSETLQELSRDPKHIGAEIGIIAVLHTWGQNLMYHPHIHCLVTGGGLSSDKKEWISSRENYFIPVKVLSKMFRGKFLVFLKDAFDDIPKKLIRQLWKTNWIVYCKPPFKHPDKVLEYLGRYTHRIAISNNRIIGLENDHVFFKWKDYKDKNKWKIMRVAVDEFIRRFLLHVLPEGYMKIRYFGICSNRSRKEKITLCKKILYVSEKEVDSTSEKKSWQDIYFQTTGIDLSVCPVCGKGKMKCKETISPQTWKPPGRIRLAV